MFVNCLTPHNEFTSPFGSRLVLSIGRPTELAVEDGYWLINQAAVEITFESPEEEAAAKALHDRLQMNPLAGLPKVQSANRNALLQIDGNPVQVPVVVVNPVGLFAQKQLADPYAPINVTLQVTDEQLKPLVKQILAELNNGEAPKEISEEPKGKGKGKPASDPLRS